MRTSFLITLAIFGLLNLTTAQICPPAETLSPCTCFESNRTIECRDIRGRFNLKQIFDRAASSVGSDVIFDYLRIRNTPIVEIEERTFESWRFLDIQIISNENLVYISPEAFTLGRNVTEVLSLSSNHVDQEGDIFEVVRGFKNLIKLVISSSGLTSVPDNAFENLDSLETISLDYNKITEFGSHAFSSVPKLKTLALQSNQITIIPAGAFQNLQALEEINLRNNQVYHVGSKAFSQTESLKKVDMYGNDMAPDGHAPDAFQGIGNITIDFTYNRNMSSMEQASFQPLLEGAGRVSVGGSSCSRNGCTFRYLYCDERVDWICDNLEEYAGRLSGYRCYSGLGLIADYCANKITH